ncbi:MAG TPA: hypothetical protein VGK32_01170 [Vicinamibacterales bacterium]|jgi:hypothetical protein
MAKRTGGTAVKTGFYWNLGKWELTMVPKPGGILPGGMEQQYIKVPIVALLVLAPLMGAVYAMFLPFIGFAMLFMFLGKKAFAMTRSGAVGVAATMTPEWRPGEAYLASKKKAPDAENGEVVDQDSIDSSVQGKQRHESRRPDLHD